VQLRGGLGSAAGTPPTSAIQRCAWFVVNLILLMPLLLPVLVVPCCCLCPAVACACCCRHLGAGGNRGTAVDVDYGGVSFEVTQLDGVLEV
jgi:hypothetical protein